MDTVTDGLEDALRAAGVRDVDASTRRRAEYSTDASNYRVVPTAVVVTTRDRAIPPSRQRLLARAIPGATTHEIDAGHAACTLQTESFVPALVEAVNTVHARRRDFAQPR